MKEWIHGLILVCLFAFISKGKGATDVSVGSTPGLAGTQVIIPVSLSSDTSIVGVQLDVAFDPIKLTSASVNKGAVLSTDHIVRSNELALGQLRVLVYSEQNLTISDGDLLQLVFGIAQGAPLGSVSVSLSGVLMADPAASPVAADSVGSGSVVVQDSLPAVVQDRRLFYNNSSFDSTSDSDAIATDKVALLPGGQAAFVNYSSFSKGINGVMVDISDLAQPGNIGVDDFGFRRGNTDDPILWSDASSPSSILVFVGGGISGSDRVSLIWEDNNLDQANDPNEAVAGEWLEVAIKSTPNTGLTEESKFYFGNGPGEVGDRSGIDANVNITDVFDVFNNQAANIAISNPYDNNRDKAVNITDLFFTFNNQVAGSQALRTINLSGVASDGITTLNEPDLPFLDRRGLLRLFSATTSEAEELLLVPSKEPRSVSRIEAFPASDGHGLRVRLRSMIEGGILMHTTDIGGHEWEPVPDSWILRIADSEVEIEVPMETTETRRFFRYSRSNEFSR